MIENVIGTHLKYISMGESDETGDFGQFEMQMKRKRNKGPITN